MKNDISIRRIQASDNGQIAEVIRSVMTDFGAVGTGFSIEDAEVNDMYAAYTSERAIYYIIERNGAVLGGAGLAQLQDGDADTCELKKMYFYEAARGLGLGKKLAEMLIADAKNMGYAKMYLETLQRMTAAQKLYTALGFKKLCGSVGNTGHCGCDAYYILDLEPKPHTACCS